jgi:geranylgeranyl transferase type-2 subunit beta
MQNDEGGLRANSRIPIADILSSFTGFLTLQDLNGDSEIDKQRLMRYASSLEQTSGGFLGAAWDEVCDVEYTFYGLGTIALLTNP